MSTSLSFPEMYTMPSKKDGTNLATCRKGGVEATDQQWSSKLSARQYQVLRNKATEPPHMAKFPETFVDYFEAGVYLCAGCKALGTSTPLYTSKMKFESDCGWPAFWTNVKGNVYKQMSGPIAQCGCKAGQAPLRMEEIMCARCDGHLGHVYKGEDSNSFCTGERHCLNSLSLVFVPRGGGDGITPKYNKFLRTVGGGAV